ncbi:hypothetical protein ACR5MH_0215 (plasmid) [Streptomyces sp. L7]
MSTTLQAVQPAEPNPVAEAIAALTAAARRTRMRSTGTGTGTEQATVEPVDFGEIASYVLTAVAANVGGVEELLAGRPGSWEADYVRQIVHSTAGDDDVELLRYRTEPVRLPFDAEDVFYDFGLGDLYDHERDAAAEATFAEGVTEEQATAAQQLVNDVEALFARDLAAYAEAYLTAARRYLTERGITCGVELVTTPAGEIPTWDALTDQVHEYARASAPLPMTGEAPNHSDGTPADAVRRAGLTYTDRARQPH